MATRKGTLIDPNNWVADKYWFRRGLRIAWYDRYQRLWTAYDIDADGHQQSAPDYAHDWQQFVLQEAQNGY